MAKSWIFGIVKFEDSIDHVCLKMRRASRVTSWCLEPKTRYVPKELWVMETAENVEYPKKISVCNKRAWFLGIPPSDGRWARIRLSTCCALVVRTREPPSIWISRRRRPWTLIGPSWCPHCKTSWRRRRNMWKWATALFATQLLSLTNSRRAALTPAHYRSKYKRHVISDACTVGGDFRDMRKTFRYNRDKHRYYHCPPFRSKWEKYILFELCSSEHV